MMERRLIGVLAVALSLALGFGCSDSGSEKDGGAKAEAGADLTTGGDILIGDLAPATDSASGDAGDAAKMGHGCKPSEGGSQNKSCSSGAPTCITLTSARDLGLCTKKCTPDDSATPLIDEDDCPTGFACGEFVFGTNTVNYCLKKCTPSTTTNPCHASSKQTCHPASVRFLSGLGQAACWFLACETNKDCPVRLSKTCTKDADCTSAGTGAFCATNNVCALPGNCTKGGLCGKHTQKIKTGAKVGDACTSDLDCPANGSCTEEGVSGAANAIGVPYRNGYCVVSGCRFAANVDDFKCGTGAECHQLFFGGLCHKNCDPTKANTCRDHKGDKGGDYECFDWSRLQIGGTPVTAKAVCQMSARQICNRGVPQTNADPCTQLAPTGNAQKMTCRDRVTGVVKSNKKDPAGICLDNSASGPFATSADAGPPKADASPPKADASPPKADKGVPKADAGAVKADKGAAKADKGVTKADTSVTKADTGVTKADTGAAKADK